MAKALKQMLATQLGTELENSPAGLMVVDPGGMTVETVEAFRGELREKAGGARLRVVHNRTARVAIREQGYDGDVEGLNATLAGSSAASVPLALDVAVRDVSRRADSGYGRRRRAPPGR